MTQTDDARGPEFPADWRDRAHSFKGMFKLQAAWADGFNAARDQIRADLATQPDPLSDPRVKSLVDALYKLHHAVCGETGFAACVRLDSGLAYPWPALDIADSEARAALAAFDTPTGGRDE